MNRSPPNASGFAGRSLGLPGVPLPEAQQTAMRRAYYAAVSHTDEQIGRVLAALAATGLRNSTLVCVFADHGWSLGEHGEWEKHSNFELNVHAPWILSLPPPNNAAQSEPAHAQSELAHAQSEAAHAQSELAHAQSEPAHAQSEAAPNNVVGLYTEHVDIMPTLLEAAAGVVLPPCAANASASLCTMGRSRVALLDPSSLAPEALAALARSEANAAFSQYARPYATGTHGPVLNTSWCALGSGQGGDPACTVGYSMVGLYAGPQLQGEYRYTEWVGFNTPGHPRARDWSDNAGTELYRHQGSSEERVNLAHDARYAAVARDFSRRLRKGPANGGWGLPRQG